MASSPLRPHDRNHPGRSRGTDRPAGRRNVPDRVQAERAAYMMAVATGMAVDVWNEATPGYCAVLPSGERPGEGLVFLRRVRPGPGAP